MFTREEKSALVAGLDLLSAQKERLGKAQPEFAPIADTLKLFYAQLRAKVGGVPDEAAVVQKK